MNPSITLSVIIVNYNVREFLEQAIKSVADALVGISHELWVVDNASTDGSVESIRRQFPQVRLIANRKNVGFAGANNQALAQCTGQTICLLNPDTIVEENTFTTLLRFLDSHPQVGAVGCKILNPDGSLQPACRRSFPTPWVAFSKISGLGTLFPKSRLFGRYNLTYLDPEQTVEVEAISGSFMLFRRTVLEQVGYLDESFFMYGEDLDYCFRIRDKGWQIYYVPTTRIIHFKGESSKKSPLEQRSLFYEAMRLFVQKHMSKPRALIPVWLLLMAIRLRSTISFASAAFRFLALPGLDLLLMTVNLCLAIYIRFESVFPWQSFVIVHVLYSAIWLTLLARHGLYTRWKFSFIKAASALVLGWIVNSAVTFFFKDIGFSRLVVLYAGVLNLVLIPGWRLLIKVVAHVNYHTLHGQWGGRFLHPQTLLVMDEKGSEEILRRLRLRLENAATLSGIVLADRESDVQEIRGIPVLGVIEQIPELIREKKIQQVIFATEQIANFQIMSILAANHGRSVSYKWIPRTMDVIIGKASVDYVEELPFLEIDDRLHAAGNRWLKRIFDVGAALLVLLMTLPFAVWCLLIEKSALQSSAYVGREGKPFYVWRFAHTVRSRWYHALPQWWSILKGDMSVVGCAPHPVRSATDCPPLLKPGWTSLERLQEDMGLEDKDRERLQLYYMKNYSPWLDVEILFQTFMKTIKR